MTTSKIKVKMGCAVMMDGNMWLASNVPADVLASLSDADRAKVARAVKAESKPLRRVLDCGPLAFI